MKSINKYEESKNEKFTIQRTSMNKYEESRYEKLTMQRMRLFKRAAGAVSLSPLLTTSLESHHLSLYNYYSKYIICIFLCISYVSEGKIEFYHKQKTAGAHLLSLAYSTWSLTTSS